MLMLVLVDSCFPGWLFIIKTVLSDRRNSMGGYPAKTKTGRSKSLADPELQKRRDQILPKFLNDVFKRFPEKMKHFPKNVIYLPKFLVTFF